MIEFKMVALIIALRIIQRRLIMSGFKKGLISSILEIIERA